MKKVVLLAVVALFAFGMTAYAGPEHNHGKADKMSGKEKTVEGTLVCLGCSLKKEAGARAECKVNGCNHAIKTADGKFIHLLENKYSKDLIAGGDYHNKPIKATGTYFSNANTFDVASFTVEGKTKSWCGHCSKMDGCMAKK